MHTPYKQRCTAGCKGLLVSPQHLQNPASLIAIIQQWQVTNLVAVPCLLAALATTASRDAAQPRATDSGEDQSVHSRPLRSLRYVVSSGDQLMQHVVQLLKPHLSPQAVLLNIYGCTETTADAMFHVCCASSASKFLGLQQATCSKQGQPSSLDAEECDQFDAVASSQTPLGDPIGGTDVYLVPVERTVNSSVSPRHYRLLVTGSCLADGYFPTTQECIVVTSLDQLEQCQDGGFLHVSSHVLQGLTDRCAELIKPHDTVQPPDQHRQRIFFFPCAAGD